MSRFRYSGSGWRTAAPITALGLEIEAEWPARHPADGTVASSGHAKYPQSDHGIAPNDRVRAIDIGVTSNQGVTLSELLRESRDDRIRYVIHDRRIFFGPKYENLRGRIPYTWFAYSGSNPHTGHVHVSTARLSSVDVDGRRWNLFATESETVLKRGDNGLAVKVYQEALQAWDPDALPQHGADADYGSETEEWVKRFQAATDLPETGVIDGVTADLLGAYHPARRPEALELEVEKVSVVRAVKTK